VACSSSSSGGSSSSSSNRNSNSTIATNDAGEGGALHHPALLSPTRAGGLGTDRIRLHIAALAPTLGLPPAAECSVKYRASDAGAGAGAGAAAAPAMGWFSLPQVRTNTGITVELTGLVPSTTYAVALVCGKTSSPTTLHRTGAANTTWLEVFRVAENMVGHPDYLARCTSLPPTPYPTSRRPNNLPLPTGSQTAWVSHPTPPGGRKVCVLCLSLDLLTPPPPPPHHQANHNSGTLEADTPFLTTAAGRFFDFESSPRVRYCVEIAKVDLSSIKRTPSNPPSVPTNTAFSEYLSCNGAHGGNGGHSSPPHPPPAAIGQWGNYSCICDNRIDRVLAHQTVAQLAQYCPASASDNTCVCAAGSVSASTIHTGWMPVSLPWSFTPMHGAPSLSALTTRCRSPCRGPSLPCTVLF
jgi:hypothetical protein